MTHTLALLILIKYGVRCWSKLQYRIVPPNARFPSIFNYLDFVKNTNTQCPRKREG
ncbi:hypothetical protein PR003_g27906 [Phytophthora rubi]|uniref:Uncharacterized protein n=1 Tax=Phytophthora rubi TaxID=129364 RepID=A0A6A4BYM1_9STRA|nr:hypothetical protein PR001_g28684 [Phytophthora rubi]KAE8978645.1 hypothetical protein PR002_g24660 [Phytophthora rubi]KAE9280636.1 hypothetical protein PR003_g27906 [Phytophthora rubi]